MTDREKLIQLLASKPELLKNLNANIVKLHKLADHLLANGVTVQKWTNVEDEKPGPFVSVLGHMTDAGEFPAVRECYRITTDEFYFPALMEFHPVDRWACMPE